ncbi:hypothetical protein [Cellulomonas telluris]|uniref:hypothetical protein n=1 Tax=Cellulomonas telluris TaxID=2306636 RepID=UPI0010A7A94F|nr:hypothetical protein [Cellulomonas telluris]
MRRAMVTAAAAAGLLLSGCAGGGPDAVPPTVATDPADDQVRAESVDDRIDALEGRLQDADEDVRSQAAPALDEARLAVGEALSVRDRGTEQGRADAAERVEAAVEELEATSEGVSDAYTRDLTTLTDDLRRLAESLRVPENDDR